MLNWPGINLPPINLWNVPFAEIGPSYMKEPTTTNEDIKMTVMVEKQSEKGPWKQLAEVADLESALLLYDDLSDCENRQTRYRITTNFKVIRSIEAYVFDMENGEWLSKRRWELANFS